MCKSKIQQLMRQETKHGEKNKNSHEKKKMKKQSRPTEGHQFQLYNK